MPGLFSGLFQNDSLATREEAWNDFGNSFYAVPTAGEPVSGSTALTLSTWMACLRNQSEDIGKLPAYVVRYINDTDKERVDSHPVGRLFSYAPNAYQTPMVFRSTMTHFRLGWGNAYAEIERGPNMEPIALHPIHPMHVMPEYNKETGRIRYKVNRFDLDDGNTIRNSRAEYIDSDNMFHLRGLGDHPLYGYSIIRMAAESLSLSIAAERYGAAFFKNKGAISAVLKHPGDMGDESRQRFIESFNEAYRGARNAGGWILLEDGMTYEPMSLAPEDAQFIQTRILQIEEICRWLRMPLSKVQHLAKANYNTLEMQNLEYTIDSLQPLAIGWEQEAKRKLFLQSEEQYRLYHNFNGLLRGDIRAQTEHLRIMMDRGVYDINEARQFLGQNSIGDNGGKRFVASNMMELSTAGTPQQQRQPQRNGRPAPTPPQEPAPPPQRPRRSTLSQEQALAIVSPVINRSQRKYERAAERAEKKHEGDAEAFADALNQLAETIRQEMADNVKEFWTALGGKEDDAILVIQGGKPGYISFDDIRDKLASILATGENNHE